MKTIITIIVYEFDNETDKSEIAEPLKEALLEMLNDAREQGQAILGKIESQTDTNPIKQS